MLKPHQKEIIQKILTQIQDKKRKILIQSPTGSGKSYLIKHIASHNPNHIILTHRIELYNDFSSYNVEMIETFYNRVKKDPILIEKYKVYLCDEVHRVEFDKLINKIEKSLVLGFTATPFRSNNQQSLDKVWQAIIIGPQPKQLIDINAVVGTENYCPPTIDIDKLKKTNGDFDLASQSQAFEKEKIYDGVIQNYNRICPGSKAILFAPNIEATKMICEKLQQSNLPAKYIDSTLDKKTREDIINWFKNTKNGILCNCSIATTGFDCPDIQTVILYRATTSLALYNQMIGRGTRVDPNNPNKKSCIVLDFGNNVERFGFWELKRDWSLEKPKTNKDIKLAKKCPKCNLACHLPTKVCQCGYVFIENNINKPKLETPSKTIELQKLEKPKPLFKIGYYLRRAKTKEEAINIIKLFGYKPGFYIIAKKIYKNLENL
jgi:superfamily II DNA or RNA helicase